MEMEEAEILLDNLLKFCGKYVKKESNKDMSREDLLGAAEVRWSGLLQVTFRNTSMRNTQDMPDLLKDLMARFNFQHEYKVILKNLEQLN